MLSVIIPTLDEEGSIDSCLRELLPLKGQGHEVIVVDGGSRDDTVALAGKLADRVMSCESGRARQMNTGAGAARGDILLFLHADTRLPPDADRLMQAALAKSTSSWGRFDVRLTGRHWLFPIIAWSMNVRSRLTAIATGDQAMFMSRAVFHAVGGFPDIPLMEDIAMSKRLKRHGRPSCLRGPVLASSRRWESHGVLRTVLLMWWLRASYALGVSPDRLVRRYYRR